MPFSPRSDFPSREVPMTSNLTRRDFIRGTAVAVLGASAAFGQDPASASKKTNPNPSP